MTPDWPPLPIGRSVIGAVSAVRRAPARTVGEPAVRPPRRRRREERREERARFPPPSAAFAAVELPITLRSIGKREEGERVATRPAGLLLGEEEEGAPMERDALAPPRNIGYLIDFRRRGGAADSAFIWSYASE